MGRTRGRSAQSPQTKYRSRFCTSYGRFSPVQKHAPAPILPGHVQVTILLDRLEWNIPVTVYVSFRYAKLCTNYCHEKETGPVVGATLENLAEQTEESVGLHKGPPPRQIPRGLRLAKGNHWSIWKSAMTCLLRHVCPH